MSVDVTMSPTFQAGVPRRLFGLPVNIAEWDSDVTRDGRRFLVAAPAQQDVQVPINVVLNWEAGLKE